MSTDTQSTRSIAKKITVAVAVGFALVGATFACCTGTQIEQKITAEPSTTASVVCSASPCPLTTPDALSDDAGTD